MSEAIYLGDIQPNIATHGLILLYTMLQIGDSNGKRIKLTPVVETATSHADSITLYTELSLNNYKKFIS